MTDHEGIGGDQDTSAWFVAPRREGGVVLALIAATLLPLPSRERELEWNVLRVSSDQA